MKTATPTVPPFFAQYGFSAVECFDIEAGSIFVSGKYVPPAKAKQLTTGFVRLRVASGFSNGKQAREWLGRKCGRAVVKLEVPTDRAFLICDDRNLFRSTPAPLQP